MSPAVLLLMAALLWVAAGGFAWRAWHFLRHSTLTTGVVVEMRARTDTEGSMTYAPKFEYRDTTGAQHVVESRVSSHPPLHVVGEKVPVRYRASAPGEGQIDRFIYNWGVPLLLAVLTAVWSVVGVVLAARRPA